MKYGSDYEFRILIGHQKPIQEYEHQGRVFVEGRKGTEFELEFKNLTNRRLLVIPSVDGLSTLDGKVATPDSTGYVVKPHATLRIPGWTVDGQNVAKFVFQDKERSYAAQMSTTESVQAGVVGVLVYGEKEAILPRDTFRTRYGSGPVQARPLPAVPTQPNWLSPPNLPYAHDSEQMVAGDTPQDVKKVFTGTYYTRTPLPSDATDVWQPNTSSAAPSGALSVNASADASFNLGTGWGQKVEFRTNQASFNKGDLKAQMALFYDSRRNLEKRGIEITKRERAYLDELPSPFQGIGCKPPPGWVG